jgi:hypothetical protein
MQFEQSPELNKYVDPTIPLTWDVRWRSLKVLLPLLLFSSAVLAEQVAFRAWLNDRNVILQLPLLVGCSLLPIALMFALFEVRTRIAHRTKRTIKLERDRVSISPAQCNRIHWKQITTWQLEPIPQTSGLSKLTLAYSFGKGGKHPRKWSMVLRQADQLQQFAAELEHFRQNGVSSGEVARLSTPARLEPNAKRVRGMWVVVLGIYFILHGLPLLFVGLSPANRSPEEARSNSKFTAKELAKLTQVIHERFSSPEQFRRFVLGLGGGFSALGGGLYVWGLSSLKRWNCQKVNTESSRARLQAV